MQCTKNKRLSYTEKAVHLVEQMTLEEKVWLMSGNVNLDEMMTQRMINKEHYNQHPYEAGGLDRLGIPPLLFCDGPRGVVCGVGKSTCFPAAMNRGATFDVELEKEIGHAIGREVRGFGGNYFGGVCVNLPYNPGWGRSQEVYGEDSFALGQMGAALVQGVQEENVIACVKHFAFNSMENSRFTVSVDCQRRTEREVYLPHFKECIDAGAASVMSSYNKYRGVYCGHNDYLLRKVLKEEWDFDGFVVSDFIMGVRDTLEAANGGMDVEMSVCQYFGDALVNAVQEGLVDESRIDEAAIRIIRTLLAFEDAYVKSGKQYGEEVLGCDAHAGLALRAARESIVLLQNKERVLPLDKGKAKRIAVIGELADKANIGDHGSSQVYPRHVVTILEGIRKQFPDAEVVYQTGAEVEKAKQAAGISDAVVIVAGYNHNDEGEFVAGAMDDIVSTSPGLKEKLAQSAGEGEEEFDPSVLIGAQSSAEGGDRLNGLGLHSEDVELIKKIGPENKNSVVILIGGNMILMDEWKDYVSAVLMAFYPGQEGGTAVAEILSGQVNPSGKLPFVLPRNAEDLLKINWETTNQFYQYYHGYTKLDKEGIKPRYPYGFGLSYTSFGVSDAAFLVKKDTVYASCKVTNQGKRQGEEIIQMYVGFRNSAIDRPVKLLRGFRRISLEPGESRTVEITCPVEKLMYYNEKTAAFELEHMEYEIYIGTSAAEEDLLKGCILL